MEWSLEQEGDTGPHLYVEFIDPVDDNDRIENFQEANTQLKVLLSHIAEGEAFAIVRNCDKNGIEAWRKLHRCFDPATGG